MLQYVQGCYVAYKVFLFLWAFQKNIYRIFTNTDIELQL